MLAAMITALIRVTHGPEALAVTLSALVPAVAAGLLGDAVILSATHDDAIDRVADAVGATLVVADPDPWRQGAQAARRDWLLCLEDGDVPQEGWIRVLDRFVGLGAPEKGLARLRRQGGVLAALRERLDRVLSPGRIRAGDLVRRRVLLEGDRPRGAVRLAATIARDPVFG